MKVYDYQEAAKVLGVGLSTLRKFIKDGLLKRSQYGRIVRISEAQLEAFLKTIEK